MNGSGRAWTVALAGLLVLAPAPARGAHAALPPCTPTVHAVAHLPARVDSLLAIGSAGTAIALTGPRSSAIRYLPHDGLELLPARGTPAWRLALPPYVTPPGLAIGAADSSTLYAVVDNAVLLIDARSGALRRRLRLDVQALGWPAAVSAGAEGRLYVAGQPTQGWAAVVEALDVGAARPTRTLQEGDPGGARPRVVWQARLGLYHAGIWLGAAGPGRLAVYLPGTYDAPGTMALLDERSGDLHPAYAVAAPPLAADPAAGRLYVADAGAIRAYALGAGRTVATATGAGPLAVAPRRGLVAFVQGDGIALAAARTLRPLGHVALPGVTALAATPDGATLLAGLRGGLARIGLGKCAADL